MAWLVLSRQSFSVNSNPKAHESFKAFLAKIKLVLLHQKYVGVFISLSSK